MAKFRIHRILSCLVRGTDVPGPNPCPNPYREKKCRPSGSRRIFSRWCHIARGRYFFRGRAGHTQNCLRFCNCLYSLAGDSRRQLHQVTVGQDVSGLIQAGLRGYRSGFGRLTFLHTSPCLAIPYFVRFQLLRLGRGDWTLGVKNEGKENDSMYCAK